MFLVTGGKRRGDARQVGARGVPGAGRAVGHAVRGAGAAPGRRARAALAPRAARARALRLRPRGRRLHPLSGARSVTSNYTSLTKQNPATFIGILFLNHCSISFLTSFAKFLVTYL